MIYIIQLDIDEETAKGRGGFGEERYEKIEFQRQVRTLYKTLSLENENVSDFFRSCLNLTLTLSLRICESLIFELFLENILESLSSKM